MNTLAMMQKLTLTSACLSVASCSLFQSGYQDVHIKTNDPKSIVRVNGAYYGNGEVKCTLAKNANYSIVCDSGNKIGTSSIKSDFSTTGLIDLVGGCIILFPAFGLCSKGAWELDKTFIYIELR